MYKFTPESFNMWKNIPSTIVNATERLTVFL